MCKKLVAITGASSGFGEAMAQTFSAAGHPVLLMARRLERMQALALPNCLCMQVDVTDGQAVRAAVVAAEAQFGPVDCMVNNAGIMLLGQLRTQNPAEWQAMFNVNLMGVMNGIHAVLDGMMQRGAGTIINISSIAGRKTFPNHAAYCATKFGVHALSENLREEVAMSGVRVVTIAPGAAETELLSHTTDQGIKSGYDQWKEHMGGVIEAQVIADAVMYAYNQPAHVCIREIVLAATRQEP